MFKRTYNSMYLERVWRGLPKINGSFLPDRSSLKASQISELIPDISIGKVTEFSVQVVMAGSNITSRLDEETTGKNYLNFVTEEKRKQVHEMMLIMCNMPVAGCLEMHSTYSRGYTQTQEISLFPFGVNKSLDVYILALSIPVVSSTVTYDNPIKGAPVSADWSAPVQWIDLGNGTPEMATSAPSQNLDITEHP